MLDKIIVLLTHILALVARGSTPGEVEAAITAARVQGRKLLDLCVCEAQRAIWPDAIETAIELALEKGVDRASRYLQQVVLYHQRLALEAIEVENPNRAMCWDILTNIRIAIAPDMIAYFDRMETRQAFIKIYRSFAKGVRQEDLGGLVKLFLELANDGRGLAANKLLTKIEELVEAEHGAPLF